MESGKMPKKKTNKSAAKRLKFTASGKIRYHRAGLSHLLCNKSKKRKRNIRNSKVVLSPAETRRVKELLSS